jgi:hypothetical protein
VFVVARSDLAVFTLGLLSDDPRRRQRAEEVAERLARLDGLPMSYSKAGRILGVIPNSLRYGAPTGTLLLRWDGSGSPTIWTIPRPSTDEKQSRLELARRYIHVYGPASPESFARWSGLSVQHAGAIFTALASTLTQVQTPIGEGWILNGDEEAIRSDPKPQARARLLPSGDAYLLLQGSDRELLLPNTGHRSELWPSRVWPGGIFVDGEIVGTWRRSNAKVTLSLWKQLSGKQREAVIEEAESLPIPGQAALTLDWDK